MTYPQRAAPSSLAKVHAEWKQTVREMLPAESGDHKMGDGRECLDPVCEELVNRILELSLQWKHDRCSDSFFEWQIRESVREMLPAESGDRRRR